jgi:hypothetical protein
MTYDNDRSALDYGDYSSFVDACSPLHSDLKDKELIQSIISKSSGYKATQGYINNLEEEVEEDYTELDASEIIEFNLF